MTDIIVESRDGKRTHYLIPDNYPAIVYLKEGGTFRVKVANLSPEWQMLGELERARR